jgi:hypothetical protein
MSRPNWKRFRVRLRRFNRRAIAVLSLLRPARISLLSRLPSFSRMPLISRLLAWNSRRKLRKRPGHFSVENKKSILKKIGARSVATALIIITALAANLMIDVKPVGADAKQIARQTNRERPAPPPLPEESSLHLQGQVALMLEVAMLKEAISKLGDVDNYTCTFDKQERIEGDLSNLQQQFIKIRHQPFSVYFKVEKGDVGREILYPISPEDGRMIVKLPDFGGRIPALKLNPNSSRAMAESRYPITMAGIKELTKMTLEVRQHDLKLGNQIHTVLRDDRTFDSRPVYAYEMTYASPKANKTYRKCVLYIDKQLMVPVYVKNHTWADAVKGSDLNNLDDTTLIEYYSFRGIKLNAGLHTMDFDPANKDYPFH